MKQRRTCPRGHVYYKSSDCPTCPVCETARKPVAAFMEGLSAPARRALEAAGIATMPKLAKISESDLLKLHGMGPASLPKLREELRKWRRTRTRPGRRR